MKKRHIFKALVCSLALCTVLSLWGCGGSQETSNSSAQASSSDVSGTGEESNENTKPEESSKEDSAPEESSKEGSNTLVKIVDSGKCGDNVNWKLAENGLLVISGKGGYV